MTRRITAAPGMLNAIFFGALSGHDVRPHHTLDDTRRLKREGPVSPMRRHKFSMWTET